MKYMIEKRRSIRVDINNICEIKVQGTAGPKYCFLKDISILGIGFISPELYKQGDIADFTIVLENKIIELEVEIIAVHSKEGSQTRYGAEIRKINEHAKIILEEYVTKQVHDEWSQKLKNLIR